MIRAGLRRPAAIGLSARSIRQLRPMAAAAAPAGGNTYYALQYKSVDDMENKRIPHRKAHLDYLKDLADQHKLAMGGALVEPVDAALLIFRNCTKEEVEKIAAEDPYMKANLISSWTVRKYMRVVGDVE